MSFRSQHSRLVPVRAYFKWLTRRNVLLANPASELDLPRLEKRLPKHVLSAAEAEQVLNQADVNEDLGVLFLTNTGDPFTPNRLTQLVRGYVDAAEIGKRGACQLFRHTMAPRASEW